MSTPTPLDNRDSVGPFYVYKIGPFALPGNIRSLLDLIARFFYNQRLLVSLESMPSRKRTHKPSLRMIEWLLTIESFNRPLYCDDGVDIYNMYRATSEVYGHTKETFDPNRRCVGKKPYRIWFESCVTPKEWVYSTVAAANFLVFCVQNNVLRYATQNHDWISRNMINAVSVRRKERRVAAASGKKAARKTFRNKSGGNKEDKGKIEAGLLPTTVVREMPTLCDGVSRR